MIYGVPNTGILIRLHIGKDLVLNATHTTLIAAEYFFEGQSAGLLPPNEDPFHYDASVGVAVLAQSSPGHQITWGPLKTVPCGLWECMAVRNWHAETTFEVHEKAWGIIGKGMISADRQLATSPPAGSRQALGITTNKWIEKTVKPHANSTNRDVKNQW